MDEPLFWSHSHYEDKCWQWWFNYRNRPLNLINLEVSWRYKMWHAEMDLGREETQLSFSLAGFGLYLHAGFNYLPIPRRLTHFTRESKYLREPVQIEHPRDLELGVSFLSGDHLILEDSFILVKLLSKSGFAGFEDYWSGPEFSFHIFDWIFGKIEYQSETLKEADTEISFPEYSYPVHIEIRKDRWIRPRYWKDLVVHRCDIDIPEGGTPVPTGKYKFGEPNDTLGFCFSLMEDGSLPEDPIEQAKQKFAERINQDREKYRYKKD